VPIERELERIASNPDATEDDLEQLAIAEALLRAEPTREQIWEVLNQHDPRRQSQGEGQGPP
jgi:hypothetical protein